ncbi:MAG: CpaF family protein [Saccharofermentanales bacterium]|jgi:pilus assembly protein CpaF|nr:ATPase, T2SS/T4P/T4SS family [Bacillota bacterium]
MLNHQARQNIIEDLVAKHNDIDRLSDKELKQLLAKLIAQYKDLSDLTMSERRILIIQLFNTMRGLDLLQPFLDDSSITEIMVNGANHVFIEREGQIYKTPVVFDHPEHLTYVITRFFGRSNRLINEQNPINGMRLEDGSRIHAILPPSAPEGPVVSIRRFTGIRPRLESLIEHKTINQQAAEFLIETVTEKRNVFISGGTGTGKTTFLNALSAYIGRQERVVTIEDNIELDLQDIPNLVRLEAREPGPDGKGAITLEQLIRSSLRLRPDRILVGEIRGAEAFDMIQAMSTGHPGSMSTGHGNNSLEMLDRISLMILMSSSLPWDAIKRLVASALDINIHLTRLPDGRRIVQEISAIKGYQNQQFQLEPLFVREGAELRCLS